MENPLMDGAKNPFKVHPGNLLVKHPPEAVGCTMCHQGQGLATTVDDAHGNVPPLGQAAADGPLRPGRMHEVPPGRRGAPGPGPFPRKALAARVGLCRLPPHGRRRGRRKGRTAPGSRGAARCRGRGSTSGCSTPRTTCPGARCRSFISRPRQPTPWPPTSRLSTTSRLTPRRSPRAITTPARQSFAVYSASRAT